MFCRPHSPCRCCNYSPLPTCTPWPMTMTTLNSFPNISTWKNIWWVYLQQFAQVYTPATISRFIFKFMALYKCTYYYNYKSRSHIIAGDYSVQWFTCLRHSKYSLLSCKATFKTHLWASTYNVIIFGSKALLGSPYAILWPFISFGCGKCSEALWTIWIQWHTTLYIPLPELPESGLVNKHTEAIQF